MPAKAGIQAVGSREVIFSRAADAIYLRISRHPERSEGSPATEIAPFLRRSLAALGMTQFTQGI